jgi:hypothetical protein
MEFDFTEKSDSMVRKSYKNLSLALTNIEDIGVSSYEYNDELNFVYIILVELEAEVQRRENLSRGDIDQEIRGELR